MPLTRPKMHQIVTSSFEVDDPILYINSSHTGANANDLGIIINRGTSGDNVGIMWDRSAQAFALVTTTATGDSTGDLTFSAYADLQCKTLELQNFGFPLADGSNGQALLTNGSGVLSWTTISVNAPSATILETARTIDITGDITATAVSFDGSANIAISAAVNDDSHSHTVATITGLSGTNTGDNTVCTSGVATSFTGSLVGDVTGTQGATVVGNDSHTHAFNNITSKTAGTGDYSTSGDLVSGRGSGGVALTINDGYGNANVTFNHQNGVPEQTGNAARIEVNTDGLSAPTMNFELGVGTVSVPFQTSTIMTLLSTGATIVGDILVSGTVDGQDIAAMGSKLSGIAANATIDQTAAEILASLKTVDVDGTPGVNAGTLGSQLNSVGAGNNTIVQRHASGYVYANYFNTTPNDIADGAITKVLAEAGNDGFMRHATASVMRTFLNVENGATASGGASLDGSTQITGTITPSINNTYNLGSGALKLANVYTTTLQGQSTSAQYADVAELYTASLDIMPGTVVCFGGEEEVTIQTEDHSTNIAGIISTNPAHLMNSGCESEHTVAVALLGRVPCMVVGPIIKGDLLVSAGNGMARAEANPKLASIIGRAVESFTGEQGVVEVLVGRV